MQAISAEWILPIDAAPLRHHAIEFENGILTAIRPARSDDPFIADAVLMPGLVNAHTHLAYTALQGLLDHLSFFPWIRKLTELKRDVMTPEDMALSTRLGILECLRSGITTVADMTDSESALAELSRSELRGIFYQEIFGVEKEHAEQSWDWLTANFPRLQDQYSTGRLNLGISPHAVFTVRPELYARIADYALRNNVPVSFHASESKEEEEFVGRRTGAIARFLEQRAADWSMLGSTAVSHLEQTGILQTRPLLAHLVQANETDIAILKRWDVSVAHCPKSNSRFGHGVAPLTAFLSAGLRTGVGTDSAASNSGLDLFEEARLALQNFPGIDETRMLQLMTLDGARALQLEDRIGSLTVGKQADFIAVKVAAGLDAGDIARHLIHHASASDVLQVWISGNQPARTGMDEQISDLRSRLEKSLKP